MIIENLLNLFMVFIDFVFAFLPNLPSFDISILETLTKYINLIFDNLGLLGFFIHIKTIKLLAPLVILAINFERIYHFSIWLVRKLPFSID